MNAKSENDMEAIMSEPEHEPVPTKTDATTPTAPDAAKKSESSKLAEKDLEQVTGGVTENVSLGYSKIKVEY